MPIAKVRERSNYQVVSMPVEEPIKVAAELMLAKSIGAIIILEDGKPVGIVTERDLLRAFYKDETTSISDPITKVMSSPLICINENKSIREAAHLMILKGIRRLGVINDRGKLVAICSMSDLMSDVDNAKLLLTGTQEISEDLGMSDLAVKISHELDNLLMEIDTAYINRLTNGKGKYQDITTYNQLHELLTRLNKISKQSITINSEEPMFFMITTKDGLSLYSRKLSTITSDGQLIAGFFYAINNLMQELVIEEGYIDRLRYMNYTIAIKLVNDKLFCYMFKGESYMGLKKLEILIEKIRKDEELKNWVHGSSPKINQNHEGKLDLILDSVIKYSQIPKI